MRDEITNLSLDDIRAIYREYLNSQNLSQNTIATSSTDAFYIWRKLGAEVFWRIVSSDDFETIGKATLLDLLKQHSRGNVEANISGYMAQLRRFRRFLQSETAPGMPAITVTKTKLLAGDAVTVAPKLPAPSVEQAEFYLALWDSKKDYHLQEDALDRLFLTLCPANTDISDILLKVCVLNDFYSTNIYKVFPVAEHIFALQIDARLRQGDVTLVDDIKSVAIGDKTWRFYSFATKYCSHHRPLDYPIYDSYVDEVLRYYRRIDGFVSFQNDDLREYASFKAILEAFRAFYHLENYNLKELDKYLWQLGKEHFNKYQ